jgi:hypothetical protein
MDGVGQDRPFVWEDVSLLVSVDTLDALSCFSNDSGSYSLNSCAPNPICRDVTTDFRENLDRVLANGTEYTGDVDTHDWVGEPYEV